MSTVARVLLMIALPIAVGASARLLPWWSGRPADVVGGLGMKFGYDTETVATFWGGNKKSERILAERRLLKLDFFYALFLGATFAASIWIGLAALGRPLLALALIPAGLMVAADWVENSVQLAQLGKFADHGKAGLQPAWIQVASAATIVKLTFVGVSALFIIVLCVMLVRGR